MSEANTKLINQAVRALVEDAKDAFIVVGIEGKIHLLNRKALRLTGKNESCLVGAPVTDILTVPGGLSISADSSGDEERVVRARMATSTGRIPVDVRIKPLCNGTGCVGAVLMIRGRTRGFEFLSSFETMGAILQRHSDIEQIYETLGGELSRLHIKVLLLGYEKEYCTVEFHTLSSKRMRIMEFIGRVVFSTIKLKITEEAFRKMMIQKALFFNNVSSIVESASLDYTSDDLRQFLSSIGISRGIAVPLLAEDKVSGILMVFSSEFIPDDTPSASTLGIQVSVALERAHHFQRLVTDLKALEGQIAIRTQELVRVKNQMESIVQSSADAIVATDLEGTITFVNRGAESMFGFPKSVILGQPITNFFAEGKKAAKSLRKIVLERGRIENAELSFKVSGGRLAPALASFSLLKDEKSNVTGIMAVLRDVTEQKRLQETLESLNSAANRIQKCRTLEEILKITAEELKRFNFHVVFMLFNNDHRRGRISHMTSKERLQPVERKMGKPLNDIDFSLENPLYDQLIRKKEAIFIQDLRSFSRLLVPFPITKVFDEGFDLLEISDKKAIAVPLILHDEAVGLLGVLSDVITAHDIPSMTAFANQVSTALENARLLEESQQRASELTRNLKEQEMLRELNTRLFQARSRKVVFDAAFERIQQMGYPLCVLVMLNEERDRAMVVRLEMDDFLVESVQDMIRTVIPGFTINDFAVPVEKNTVLSLFFEKEIPLVTSDIRQSSGTVSCVELTTLYEAFTCGASAREPLIAEVADLLPYRSCMVFPIRVGGQTVGAMAVASSTTFSEKEFALMNTAGEMVSSALERITQSEKLAETLSELRAVQRINTLLNMGAPLEQILSQISTSIERVYRYQFAYPLLLDPSRRYLTFNHIQVPPPMSEKIVAAFGVNLDKFRYPVTEDAVLLDVVVKQKKCIIRNGFEDLAAAIPISAISRAIEMLSSDFSHNLGLKEGGSIMIAPLPYGDEVIGILLLGHNKVLTEEDFNRLEYFLDQVGIAMAKSEVEHRLRQSLQELRELDQMKSEFIDIASHELRTPLTTLKLYLEMMALEQYGRVTDQLRERIRVMEEGVNRLEDIINQTLVASRLIKNKLTLENEAVSLLDVTTEVVRQLRPLWNSKHQNIFLESPPDLPLIEGDRNALFTAVNNLVDNAIRYSPENTEILIRFIVYPGEIECVVIDHGCGIPAEHTEKIFDEFYIVPSETEYARMDGRTGLGLFIAKGIVERHNGRIWVESVLNEGSAFHVVLPSPQPRST
ncbi:MAG: GAF domain-containing protein [Theionarchaea archaeon]|nr:GAF domain-containing protein [Theionarchaea archaeon]MBU7038060.1 GAF domain-containing protein [Theionarchaea archaeon]